MSLDNGPLYTGGCQCGAVRFRVEGALGDASICHCRMCQKASGNFYLPLVSVRGAKLDLDARRAEVVPVVQLRLARLLRRLRHAADFEAPDGVALAIGAFDDPAGIAPTIQWGVEAKLPYVDADPALAGRGHDGRHASAPYLADLVSYQHPDHDTEQWPPEERIMTEIVRTGGCQCGAVRFRIAARSGRRRSAIAACARSSSAPSSARW